MILLVPLALALPARAGAQDADTIPDPAAPEVVTIPDPVRAFIEGFNPEDEDFFGAFALDPQRPAEELEIAYSPGLTEAERKLPISDVVKARLGGYAEYADRVILGPIELIVRDVDEKGRITELGVSFEPQSTPPQVPVFLSAGEMFDRVRALFRRGRKPAAPSGPDSDASPPAPEPG